ncbi:MAG: acylphosphatase [Gammaproteobacteria bacterium]|nr:acylphosphatase [Gammaproteobacteria bacterium]
MRSCRHYRVSGQVQGVFFRASAARRATELGLCGFARNLADGRVEVLACGAPAALKELEGWLAQGPPLARVTAVDSEPAEDPGSEGFGIEG